jgi:hypothetical protein
MGGGDGEGGSVRRRVRSAAFRRKDLKIPPEGGTTNGERRFRLKAGLRTFYEHFTNFLRTFQWNGEEAEGVPKQPDMGGGDGEGGSVKRRVRSAAFRRKDWREPPEGGTTNGGEEPPEGGTTNFLRTFYEHFTNFLRTFQ